MTFFLYNQLKKNIPISVMIYQRVTVAEAH